MEIEKELDIVSTEQASCFVLESRFSLTTSMFSVFYG